MVALCEAWLGEQWWQWENPVAFGGFQADGCSLLAPFGSGATPTATASPGIFLGSLQAWAWGPHGPQYEETPPAASGSSY